MKQFDFFFSKKVWFQSIVASQLAVVVVAMIGAAVISVVVALIGFDIIVVVGIGTADRRLFRFSL